MVNSAAEAAESDYIAARGPRDLAQASPRYQAAYHERYGQLLAIARDMHHCPPCSKSWQSWLEWRLPPAPIVLCPAGKPSVRQIAEHQEARYQQWHTTVRTQQDLIHRICAARHQGRRR